MSETHEKIKEAVEAYLDNNDKFAEKGNKAAGTRARKALMDLKKLAHTRRAEIQSAKNTD